MTYEALVSKLKEEYESMDASAVKEHVAIQFNVTGEAEGKLYLEIADGKIRIEPYEYYDRDVLVTTSEENLLAIAEGKLDFVTAFTLGKIKAEGNLGKGLLLKEAVKKAAAEKKAAKKAAPKKKTAGAKKK